MRIGIDISTITSQLDGVNCYLINIVEHLSLFDRENEYFLYTNRKVDFKPLRLAGNFRVMESSNSHRLIWMQAQLPFLLKRDRVEVLHSPCYNIPLASPVPCILTIHDMTSSLFPGQFIFKHRIIYNTLVPLCARMADRIIAVSTQTKEDIVKIFRVPQEKIAVIHEAANSGFYRRGAEEVSRIRDTYNIKGKYILFVGTLQPRKNLVYLLKAFHRFLADKPENKGYMLVLSGKKGWFYNDIFRTAAELGIGGNVLFPGHIPEEDLPALYSGASLFVFPSLYEGFGLPPLEAMSCGVPVIASDTSCFPEILADSALLVNPLREEEMSAALSRVLWDGQLAERLSSKGYERVKQFSWDKAARRTLEEYKAAAVKK